jgi:CDP-diacylglycerol--serine O-phosphatidyltransferase
MPNFFTMGNMFCGFMAAVFALYVQNFTLAAWMIILASFFDAMDGKVARLANASSKFGVEYDSLADNVSFGLAPSALIYAQFFHNWGIVGLLISFFPLLFVSIRLARFNVQLEGFEKSEFYGLPSPAAALTIATYILFLSEYFPGEIFPRLLTVLTISVSVLMVSTIRYDVLPTFTFKGGPLNATYFVIIIIMFITALIFPKLLLFPYILIYVLSGFGRFLFRLGQGKGLRKEER